MQTPDVALAVGEHKNRAVRVTGARVYVVRCKLLEEIGGIHLPHGQTKMLKSNWGTVIAVGPLCSRQDTVIDGQFLQKQGTYNLHIGDYVILPETAGSDEMYKGPMGDPEELIIAEEEIIAFVQKAEMEAHNAARRNDS